MNKIILGCLFFPTILFGAASDTATVTFTISAINELAISGSPATLVVNTATAGSDPVIVIDETTSYNITTNQTSKVITGAVSSNLPAGITLSANLDAPSGATSMGPVVLTTSNQNLVTGISNVAQSNLTIHYALTATVAAMPQGPTSRIVTLTIGP